MMTIGPVTSHFPSDGLQQLPPQHRWALADETLLRAIARGVPMVRGAAGSRLRRLLGFTNRVGLIWPTVVLVSLVELIKTLRIQHSAPSPILGRGDAPTPPYFFVGFGAGAEEELYERYRNQRAGVVARISQIDINSLASWHRVAPWHAIREWARALKTARQAVDALPSDLVSRRLDFLTWIGSRAARFAYMTAWFRALRDSSVGVVQEVAFVANDTAAFAAVEAGLPACYLQHGMLSRSLLFAEFTRVEALSAVDADYLARRIPRSLVTHGAYAKESILPATMSNSLLVASIYGDPSYIERIIPFLRWAADRKLNVIVRPHPREDGSFWTRTDSSRLVSVQPSNATFQEHLAKVRPRLVVSWFSTALADALEMGIIPVSVCGDHDPNVADMVYPLFQHCLRWPHDIDLIERLLVDDASYAVVLSRLHS